MVGEDAADDDAVAGEPVALCRQYFFREGELQAVGAKALEEEGIVGILEPTDDAFGGSSSYSIDL